MVRSGSPDRSLTSPRRGERGGRLSELDLLRFLAAVAVMLHHFTGVRYYSPWGDARKVFPELAPFTSFGYLGVQFFFIISGFVIVMSAWHRTPGEFASSRFVRLFPAYWFSVALALLIYLGSGLASGYPVSKEGPLTRFLPNLTMLQDGIGAPESESAYWTLWVELHFYALVALLVWRGVSYRACVIFMAAWLLAGTFAQEAGDRLLQVLLIPAYAPYFIAGMAFFLVHRYGPNLVMWLLIGACWALGTYSSTHRVSPFVTWPGLDRYVVPAVITAMFALMTLVCLGRMAWLRRWKGLTALGGLTYPLYLVHETVSRPVITALGPRLGRWSVLGVTIALAVSTAWLAHRWVERPLQRWMRPRLARALAQIRTGLPRAPVAAAAATPGEPAGPAATEPVPTEPVPTEPAPIEPAPTEPAPTEPVAT
ncbi:MAG: Peptidoglycan/LPS O-acetylase OafA/YrhL [Streptosporangiaceae bacterium]|nr:Peptidoglycan/LPS O-acetylase OafA/YrhL [Streptosporangiaceae bacterium]